MARALRVVTRSPQETSILGTALAALLLPGDIVSLTGELGAGKTVFVQGLATALGAEGPVTSPSFTLVHEYAARYRILHLDVYRLDSFQEVLDLGFEELLDPDAIVLLEWGDAVEPLLPRTYLTVDLRRVADPDSTEERIVTFRPRGLEWIRKLQEMRTTAETLLDAASSETGDALRFMEASTEDGGKAPGGDR
jgi:tRNA threonylcarbamoyladenosine biosynthesis protein TsaE